MVCTDCVEAAGTNLVSLFTDTLPGQGHCKKKKVFVENQFLEFFNLAFCSSVVCDLRNQISYLSPDPLPVSNTCKSLNQSSSPAVPPMM